MSKWPASPTCTDNCRSWLRSGQCDCGATAAPDIPADAAQAAPVLGAPSHTEAVRAALDGAPFIRALVGAWDCCGTCAGGLLAKHDAAVAAKALADTATTTGADT